jgi:hypothetical protein
MAIVNYQETSANEHGRASTPGKGVPSRIDLESGHVFDADGNTLARWQPVDSSATRDTNALASEYAASYAFQCACHAQSTARDFNNREFGRERAQHMLSASGRQDESNPVWTCDLGVSEVHIPRALPNYAAGYRNEAPMADLVSPPLLVPNMTDYYFTFNKEDAFQRAYPNGGAGGGAVPEINPRLSNASFATVERALGGFISTQLQANADAPLRIVQAATKRVMNAMLLEREIRVQSLLRTSGNWDSYNVAAIGASYKWNGGASADPVNDILTRCRKSWGQVTGMLMSRLVWDCFKTSPAVRAYIAYKSGVAPMPKASEIQALLDLPPLYVSDMKYINSSGLLDFVWGADVVLFRQPDEMPPSTQDDVATSYTFRWNLANKPIPDGGTASGGFIVRQFYVNDRGGLGGIKVVVVHQDAEVMTSKYVGGLLTSAYQ